MMASNMLNILAFFFIGVVASHAALLAPELYWNSMLPNTPMPKSIRDMLPSDADEVMEEKSSSAGNGKSNGTSVDVGKGGVNVDAGKGTNVGVGRKGVGVNTGRGTNVGVGKGGVSVSTGRKGKPVRVGVKPGPNPFNYLYAATEDQLNDNPDIALFFLEKDLHTGTTMNLHFTTDSSNELDFVSRQVADSLPFSSKNFPETLNHFSVLPGSPEAQVMKNTIKECEEPGIKGEDKYCATSLESMIDFTASKLGTNVEAISTEVEKETPKQKYTIVGGGVVNKAKGNKAVACHKMNYPYAVFYCHATQTTKAYVVPLEGADGAKVKAVAVCHTDTSAWNPKHLAFQVLKIKPGTKSVCHFLPQDHIVWVPK